MIETLGVARPRKSPQPRDRRLHQSSRCLARRPPNPIEPIKHRIRKPMVYRPLRCTRSSSSWKVRQASTKRQSSATQIFGIHNFIHSFIHHFIIQSQHHLGRSAASRRRSLKGKKARRWFRALWFNSRLGLFWFFCLFFFNQPLSRASRCARSTHQVRALLSIHPTRHPSSRALARQSR